MYAIKDENSAGRVMMWVKKEPTFLPKNRYAYFTEQAYQRLKNATFWVDEQGNITFEKPYSFTYHELINGEWKLNHDKEREFIAHCKTIFSENLARLQQYGLEEQKVDYLQKQITQIETLDQVEEYSMLYIGGKYETVYNHRFSLRL